MGYSPPGHIGAPLGAAGRKPQAYLPSIGPHPQPKSKFLGEKLQTNGCKFGRSVRPPAFCWRAIAQVEAAPQLTSSTLQCGIAGCRPLKGLLSRLPTLLHVVHCVASSYLSERERERGQQPNSFIVQSGSCLLAPACRGTSPELVSRSRGRGRGHRKQQSRSCHKGASLYTGDPLL